MKIKLIWTYLNHDVQQLAHRYANARLAEHPDMESIADLSGNASDEQLIRRWVITGTAHLRRILREYLEKKTEEADDKLPMAKESWGFVFKTDVMDSHGLAELMHWFVVRWCAWQWCQMFSPADSSMAKAEVDDMEGELQNLLIDADMPMKERREVYEDTDEIVYIPNE